MPHISWVKQGKQGNKAKKHTLFDSNIKVNFNRNSKKVCGSCWEAKLLKLCYTAAWSTRVVNGEELVLRIGPNGQEMLFPLKAVGSHWKKRASVRIAILRCVALPLPLCLLVP